MVNSRRIYDKFEANARCTFEVAPGRDSTVQTIFIVSTQDSAWQAGSSWFILHKHAFSRAKIFQIACNRLPASILVRRFDASQSWLRYGQTSHPAD